jgi:hypothetical protein
MSSISLNQGTKYQKYQQTIIKNLERKIGKVSAKEGFTNNLSSDTSRVINNNDYDSQQQIIQKLRHQYNNALSEYEKLTTQINGSVTGYLNRVNTNNPYLNKTIQFTTGQIAYVTNQGVVKLIPSQSILNSVQVPKQFIQTDIPWNDAWNKTGETIPTIPPLMSGTAMKMNQSIGYEGTNIYVDELLTHPSSTYQGCYRNTPPESEIKFNPVIGTNNAENGFTSSASSIYQNNNNFAGPWCAFDNNIDTWWHSYTDSPDNLYDANTGQYTGISMITLKDQTQLKGEYLQLTNPTQIALTRYEIQGRQGCCGDPNGRDPNTWYILGYDDGWYEIDYQANISFNWQIKSFTIASPKPYSAYAIIISVAGDNNTKNGNRRCVQIATWNLYTTSNYTAIPSATIKNAGKMSFEQCQNFALTSNNKYFGLSNDQKNQGNQGNQGNQENQENQGNQSNCLVSDELANFQVYGEGLVYNKIQLWSSNTSDGSIAILNSNGTLSVNNTSGSSIFLTTVPITDNTDPFIGCYSYSNKSIETYEIPGINKFSMTFDQCQDLATSKGYQYFGIGGGVRGDKINHCLGINNPKLDGMANNCKNPNGGIGSASIYATDISEGACFLILQDDGNMCIYRGTSPEDNQGKIWCSETSGKQQQPNSNFTADKGKYGKNWILNGSTIAANDFIGSKDGSIYLLMQTDGNLVLLTNTAKPGCSINSKGISIGEKNINSVYQLNNMGFNENVGKLAYIDQNSDLHSYPSDNLQYTNTYTKMSGYDLPGNDIVGAMQKNATFESCKSVCDGNSKCAAFTFSDGTCNPKSFSSNSAKQIKTNMDLYTRNKSPISPPIGVTNAIMNVDSLLYQNYENGGELSKEYGLSNATNEQKKKLTQLQTKLSSLSSELVNLTGQFTAGSQQATEQAHKNYTGIKKYVHGITDTNNQITNFDKNINNILKDSDIVILQKNYDYLFWSILATGTVLIAINVVHN